MKFVLHIIFFLFLILRLPAQIQQNDEQSQTFFFDAVCFKNIDTLELSPEGRVDVIVLVPFQTLRFEKSNETFTARYEIYVDIFDSSGKKLQNDKIQKMLRETDYMVTQGSSAGFDIVSRNYFINAGNYEIRINMIDLLSGKSFSKTRTITIVKFNKYRIALSGIMLLSTIEERDGKFKITPHVSDNVAMLNKGFFIFFEVYNNKNFDSLDFVYELYDDKNELISKSEIFSNNVNQKVNQLYKKVKLPDNCRQGVYKIRLLALTRYDRAEYTEDDILAITERSIKFEKAMFGNMLDDLDKAIRCLRYIAVSSEMNLIESAVNEEEKQKRFEEFWKDHDPTPNTERNEAFDEYYTRIQYANKNFKSYTEGWLTDMGMVYIVFGQPDYIDKSDTYSTRTLYVKWTYLNNREFLFSDETGMGDYRLVRPYTVTEKYKFGN